jgi:hypothetical protein
MLEHIERVLTELHHQQRQRALRAAERVRPGLTSEDLLNPDNFTELILDPDFMYEDGAAAGILAAKMALRASLLR